MGSGSLSEPPLVLCLFPKPVLFTHFSTHSLYENFFYSGQIQKSYLLDLCLSLDTTLCNLFEGLKDRRTSLAGALAYIESLNSQQVFFGYGRQPLLLEDKDWESYSNLVELGSWAELKEGSLKIKDIMTVPQNLASAFCQDNGKSSQSILYVLYIFSLTGSEVSFLEKRKA